MKTFLQFLPSASGYFIADKFTGKLIVAQDTA